MVQKRANVWDFSHPCLINLPSSSSLAGMACPQQEQIDSACGTVSKDSCWCDQPHRLGQGSCFLHVYCIILPLLSIWDAELLLAEVCGHGHSVCGSSLLPPGPLWCFRKCLIWSGYRQYYFPHTSWQESQGHMKATKCQTYILELVAVAVPDSTFFQSPVAS